MRKNHKLSLLCGVMACCAAVMSGCNNVGNQQSLEVQNHIMAGQGLQTSALLKSSDVIADFKDIAYGNDLYMIVGSDGAIYTSPDAMQWTERVGVTDLNLNAVAYNSKYKKFYAVGDSGKVFTSKDGVAWIEYKTLNKSVNLSSINVLPDGNEIIGGNSGNIFEIEFRSDDGEKNTVNVRKMQAKNGNENSVVTSTASSSLYMAAGSSLGSLNVRENADFTDEVWEFSGSNNTSGVTDIAYSSKNNLFISLSKNGYINTANAKTYNSPWSALSYTNYPDSTSYQSGITTNSIAVDANSPYTFIAGGGKDNKDTFIRYTKDIAKWGTSSENTLHPATGALNKVRCFAGNPEPMCIAVGDKRAIVIIKIKDDNITPEPIDVTNPKIILFRPDVDKSDGDKDINTNPLMKLVFNKPVKNVDNSNVVLYEEHKSSGAEVKLTNFEGNNNQDDYTFKPAHKLRGYTNYVVHVKNGIKDKYGKSIESADFSFTTSEMSYPEVRSVIPADKEVGVSTTPNIEVLFSEPVYNVNTKNVTLHEGTVTGANISISNPTAKSDVGYVFAPINKLKAVTQYCVVFGTGITDVYGTSIKEHVSCFKTGDFEAPTVTMLNPANNATDVSLLPSIKFKFSKNVIGVDHENVTLHEGSATGAVVTLGNISADGSTYATLPTSSLKLNTSYYLVFSSGIKDEVSEQPLVTTTFSFKTRADAIAAVASSEACMYTYTYTGTLSCVKKLLTGSIYKVVYSDTYLKFIAVGENGVGFASNDAKNWSTISTGTKKNLRAIAFLNSNESTVVAVGDQGAIVVSSNMGTTWTVKTSPAGTKDLKNIYSNGKEFLIAVDDGEWLYSDDKGATWSKKTDITPLPKAGVQNILSSNGHDYIVGGNNGVVYVSSDDMKSWNEQSSVLHKATGKSVYSSFTDYLYVKTLGMNLLLGNNNTLFASNQDGISKDNWTRVTGFDGSADVDFLGASANSDGDIYMVTIEGSNADGNMYMSTDGINWIRVVKLKDNSFFSVVAVD